MSWFMLPYPKVIFFLKLTADRLFCQSANLFALLKVLWCITCLLLIINGMLSDLYDIKISLFLPPHFDNISGLISPFC